MKPHFLIPEQSINSLEEYRQIKGNALATARTLSSMDIIARLKSAGLRGRGGAGFPVGIKWESLYGDDCATKYVVVNAAEGEPGTFKDRFLLRKNPYSLIEGILIAAHVLKTNEAYIAIKKTFLLEIKRLENALTEFKNQNELQNVRIHLVTGPEDYLFGEEKALLNVIEGIGPLPREAHYPPYERGLFATPLSRNPALVSNVESYSRVADIITHGAESFKSVGSQETPGPVIVSLYGDVKRPGVYEIEPGITLREMIDTYALGPKKDNVKAILSGVSNAVMTSRHLDEKVGFTSLSKAGGGLGSGGFMIYDESRSMPRLTQVVARFLYKESCNQCTNCKRGLGIASATIDELFVDYHKALIERIIMAAKSAPQATRCFLPEQGKILIPSLINSFMSEFLEMRADDQSWSDNDILPRMVDYLEAENRFVLKQDVKKEPQQADWESTEKIYFN